MSTTQIFWNKSLSDAANLLTEAGFKCATQPDSPSIWGTIEPESYNVGKHHFTALFRDVFVGEAVGGWYATSTIHGDMRFYRCRTVYEGHQILNVFGHGKTPVDAVNMFLTNYKNKRYNIGS